MTWKLLRGIPGLAFIALFSSALSAQTVSNIAANDNRKPAGDLRAGVLTLQFDMKKGNWHPESEQGETIPVYAFGEAGKELQVPGPTIRVTEGTTIDIALHNSLTVAATLHGFHKRPGKDEETVTVAPGATEHVKFVAGAPGTYM